jgi:hypothetical protein
MTKRNDSMSNEKSEHTVGEMKISGLDVSGITTRNVHAALIPSYPYYSFEGSWGDDENMRLGIYSLIKKDDVYNVHHPEGDGLAKVYYQGKGLNYHGVSGTITITDFDSELQKANVYVDISMGSYDSEDTKSVRIEGEFVGFKIYEKNSPEGLALIDKGKIS